MYSLIEHEMHRMGKGWRDGNGMRKYLFQFSRIFVMRPSSCSCQLLGSRYCSKCSGLQENAQHLACKVWEFFLIFPLRHYTTFLPSSSLSQINTEVFAPGGERFRTRGERFRTRGGEAGQAEATTIRSGKLAACSEVYRIHLFVFLSSHDTDQFSNFDTVLPLFLFWM